LRRGTKVKAPLSIAVIYIFTSIIVAPYKYSDFHCVKLSTLHCRKEGFVARLDA
jgi:hypothetical protein